MITPQPWPSPAKLNLFLHITGRRDDGYHELQSVFQLIDYGDQLFFAARQDGEIDLHCDILTGNADQVIEPVDNLVWKAANALKLNTGCALGADIRLHKQLPMGAGLGGGSSNAATTLIALDKLWQLNCGSARLEEIGLSLGADVPVFLRGVSAWAEGIGEKLRPIELPSRWYVVLNPPIHVSTAELFNDRQLTRDCTPITIRAFQEGERTRNVFEPLVCERHKMVRQALELLEEVALNVTSGFLDNGDLPRDFEAGDFEAGDFEAAGLEAGRLEPGGLEPGWLEPRMTGTGSSVFLPCVSEALAHKVLAGVYEHCKKPGYWAKNAETPLTGFVAKGVERSPLVDRLREGAE